MSFNWKRLKYWNIGHNIYEVFRVKKIPTKYNNNDMCIKNQKNEITNAIIDTELKKIFIMDNCFASPECFLENLFHELKHADDDMMDTHDINTLTRLTKSIECLEVIYEMKTELKSIRILDMLRNNMDNFEYILKYYRNRQKKRRKNV